MPLAAAAAVGIQPGGPPAPAPRTKILEVYSAGSVAECENEQAEK